METWFLHSLEDDSDPSPDHADWTPRLIGPFTTEDEADAWEMTHHLPGPWYAENCMSPEDAAKVLVMRQGLRSR